MDLSRCFDTLNHDHILKSIRRKVADGSLLNLLRLFLQSVRKITRRNSPVNLKKVIADLNPVVRGIAYYFRIANCKAEYRALTQWIRRRLRAKQLKLWKRAKRLHRRLRQLGYQGEFDLLASPYSIPKP